MTPFMKCFELQKCSSNWRLKIIDFLWNFFNSTPSLRRPWRWFQANDNIVYKWHQNRPNQVLLNFYETFANKKWWKWTNLCLISTWTANFCCFVIEWKNECGSKIIAKRADTKCFTHDYSVTSKSKVNFVDKNAREKFSNLFIWIARFKGMTSGLLKSIHDFLNNERRTIRKDYAITHSSDNWSFIGDKLKTCSQRFRILKKERFVGCLNNLRTDYFETFH